MSAFVNPVLNKLDLEAKAEATRLFARLLGSVMPVWYVASLLLLLSETIIHLHNSVIVWLGIAIALWSGAIALSIVSLLPINSSLARMAADEWTEGTQRDHRKWDTLHRVRVFALTVSMIFFLAGIGI